MRKREIVGQVLPDEAQRALLKAKIKPGCILHTFCGFINNPKNKFVVVAHIDFAEDLILAFIINSRVHPLIEKDPALKTCQVKLEKATYAFLSHDSYLNCAEVCDSLEIDDITTHLLTSPTDIRGCLSEKDLLEVIQVVHSAKTITEYDKNLIIKSLGE